MKWRFIPSRLSPHSLPFPFISGDAGVFIWTRNERVIDRGGGFNHRVRVQLFSPSLPVRSLSSFAGLDAAPQQHSVREICLNDEKRT